MSDSEDLHPETIAAQALHYRDPATGGIVPTLQPSTTFARDPDYQPHDGSRTYARDQNPTYEVVERVLAHLDEGRSARVFSSGMAAVAAVLHTLKPGDHIAAPRIMYWAARKWLQDQERDHGIQVSFYETADLQSLEDALRPGQTKLVWAETPCNPTWDVLDIRAAATLAHVAGARLVVDSTVATPALSQPLALGADIVLHAATKYLNGHSDVVAGVLVTAAEDDLWDSICRNRVYNGGILGSFEAWLLQRGLRTLYLRVSRASDSAMKIAQHFEGHGAVAQVLYPGLPSHPGHDIAKAQMTGGFGGMLSLRHAGGREAALATARACRVFLPATSLGGVESLIEHRATVEGPESPVPDDLLRLSIGIEAADDLIADLEQALSQA